MYDWKIQKGTVLVEIKGVYLLAASREARKCLPYIREINEAGAFIWQLMEQGKEPAGIIDSLKGEFDIPEVCSLEADVGSFLKSLAQDGYINREDLCLEK